MKTLIASIIATLSMPPSPNPIRLRGSRKKIGGASGNRQRKNPFQGIACNRPYPERNMRHIEGARDNRPVHPTHYRDQCLRRIFDRTITIPEFRDTNPHPVAFLP